MLFISSIFFLFAAFINNWKGGGRGEGGRNETTLKKWNNLKSFKYSRFIYHNLYVFTHNHHTHIRKTLKLLQH